MTYVVDASVAIKWFIPENLHQEALALLYDQGGNLEAPDFILLEIANIAWKKCRKRELSPDQVRSLLPQCRDYFAKLHATSDLVDRAQEISLTLDHPIYDCLYLASAIMIEGFLVTADDRLFTKARGTRYENLVHNLALPLLELRSSPSVLGVSLTIFDDLVALWIKASETGLNIRESAIPGSSDIAFSLTDAEAKMLLDSPPIWKIRKTIDDMPRDHRILLLALGWLGAGDYGTNFQHFVQQAQSTIDAYDVTHLLNIVCHLEKGLSILRAQIGAPS